MNFVCYADDLFQVTERERKNAGTVYLKKYAGEYHRICKVGGTAAFNNQHPTFAKLSRGKQGIFLFFLFFFLFFFFYFSVL